MKGNEKKKGYVNKNGAEDFKGYEDKKGYEDLNGDEGLKGYGEGLMKHWRCYHSWTSLKQQTAICKYCKEATIAMRFEPT